MIFGPSYLGVQKIEGLRNRDYTVNTHPLHVSARTCASRQNSSRLVSQIGAQD